MHALCSQHFASSVASLAPSQQPEVLYFPTEDYIPVPSIFNLLIGITSTVDVTKQQLMSRWIYAKNISGVPPVVSSTQVLPIGASVSIRWLGGVG